MQDSLEDYLKFSKQDDTIKISKEMVVTAQLKKECDARAMKIVEFSIEGKLRPEIFTKCLPFINQSHYQDIVEERAITKLCGYSICGKRIPDMPKKQYFISTKSNKVYDITERKNFCSNFCYKASMHIKKQIDNSPLWLRTLENIPEYKLLNCSDGGLPGEYIDQGIVKPVEGERKFTSINSFAHASLGDIMEPEKDKNQKKGGFKKPVSRLKSTMQTIKESDDVEEENSLNDCAKKSLKKSGKHNINKRHSIVSLPSIEENEERLKENENVTDDKIKQERLENDSRTEDQLEKKLEKVIIKDKPKKKNTKKRVVDVESIIKKVINEWVTLETCIFIHGEEKVKRILNEHKLSDYFDRLHIEEMQMEQQMRYMDICRRLHLQEMADDKFDGVLTGTRKLKPLPDFKKLREDAEEMKLKVKSFYDGTMYEQDDKNFPQETKSKAEPPPEEVSVAVLPPVDANSQNLMRRKIFLNSLMKTIQQLMQTLGTSYTIIWPDLQALVRTFSLRADNITFKPFVWNYIGLVLLNLLSWKDESLKNILEEPRAQEYINMLIESLPHKKAFINDVLDNFRDLEVFVEQYITKDDSIQ
ncbi:unnamed protein product [Ceutorhynchus assimilis]|uniref:RNA polymerase II subunit B1 CTD phosphatase RPAP2 homolog n=1 Tax=Ceutorhynchus assimilis TaxID=467358 RepID=A0A9N9MCA2_9CUCU|nr:unnamed protein product [Ceutorhynchus assimilis]